MESISAPRTAISILLVEDEEDSRTLLAAIVLKKYPDIKLYTAINGRTGLELFKTHMQDIVITDINMPEMNGVQMIRELRVLKPNTKFIVLTGDSGKHYLQDSSEKEPEVHHYIVKPVRFSHLFAAIDQCIGESEHQGSLPARCAL
jgi:YesN/AraC family two-component response regulator